MLPSYRRYSEEEIYALYRAAKNRSYPVDRMDWRTFLGYLKTVAPDLLNMAASFNPVNALVGVKPREASLLFNGETLFWQEDWKATSWPAYSGAKKYFEKRNYSIEVQKITDKGPIPAGYYRVPQARYQEREDHIWERMKNSIGKGNWRGGYQSWGDYRVWLEPESGTETYGRGNFSIHGGTRPGSAGCIDLVENMPEFVKLFRSYGKDMRLKVEYPIV